MIRLNRRVLERLDPQTPDVDGICTTLQYAIELEHATIPVYLYALYSLDAVRNPEIVKIIESVVFEEMLHMTLAANVLNALGGTPAIGHPGFIPDYPGPLPGGVESELTVSLRPFSMAQLGMFLDIEQPESPIVYKAGRDALEAGKPVTIGQFYTAISVALGQLGDGAFVRPARHQVGPDLMTNAVVVTDVASAQRALAIIIDQGEGTSTSPLEVTGGGYAHYYRFMQIQKQHFLLFDPHVGPGEKAYSYSGEPIAFDPAGVYPVPPDPSAAGYPAGSQQRALCDRFNYTYTALLLALDAFLCGDNTGRQMDVAIGLMMSLKSQAKAMMSGIPDPGRYTGPSFEYQASDPATAR